MQLQIAQLHQQPYITIMTNTNTPCNPEYYPMRIQIGTLGLVFASTILLYLAIFQNANWIYHWMIQILIVLGLLTIKWAAPDLPWTQVMACAGAILFIHAIGHYLAVHVAAPFAFAADHAVEMVCVLIFGRNWVIRCYVPGWANKWH